MTSLEEGIAAVISRHPEHDICVAYRDLRTGRTHLHLGDVVVHAASTMKIAVMMEAFRQADAGTLDLDGPVPVRNTFKSIMDGSPYTLQAEDDADQSLYAQIGTTVPTRELVRLMMVRSSNLATNLLVDLLSAESIQATVEGTGAANLKVWRGVEDNLAYQAGRNNVVTARDLLILLEAIHRQVGFGPASRRAMLDILLAQEFNGLIPAGLPPGTPVAHKTGQITRIHHDAAIVDPDGSDPWILVVLTRGFIDPDTSAAAIADVARAIHAGRPLGRSGQ
jgi:beta-lactamase class A